MTIKKIRTGNVHKAHPLLSEMEFWKRYKKEDWIIDGIEIIPAPGWDFIVKTKGTKKPQI